MRNCERFNEGPGPSIVCLAYMRGEVFDSGSMNIVEEGIDGKISTIGVFFGRAKGLSVVSGDRSPSVAARPWW